MSAPSIIVVVPLEARPWGRVIAMVDVDACRAAEWAERHREEAHQALDQAIDAASRDCQHFVWLDDARRAA